MLKSLRHDAAVMVGIRSRQLENTSQNHYYYIKFDRLEKIFRRISHKCSVALYEGWKFNSGNYLFTTDTK